ncbi:MAG: hypothetical protein LUB56_00045 [Coprobacillus sp.]|nr:hypothetical protein [Coprobacillus sp.]
MKTINIFINRIKENFKINTPIFRKEIEALFKEYSSIYTYQLIKKAVDQGLLIHYSMGIYYLPSDLPFNLGKSSISPRDVLVKEFIEYEDEVYGIYSGLALQNSFSLTSQVPATIEVVSNKESSKGREIIINERHFIVRKSRAEITSDNVFTYTLLELFTINNGIPFNESGVSMVNSYIKEHDITKEKILSLANYFPSRTLKNMLYMGVI